MITGTNNFFDKESAYKYYRGYGLDKMKVDEKLTSGEIKTGHPETKEGERVFLNLSEMRYFVESK